MHVNVATVHGNNVILISQHNKISQHIPLLLLLTSSFMLELFAHCVQGMVLAGNHIR